MNDKPTPLHKQICKACGRPITKGQLYRTINTPEGPMPVHESCLKR